MKKLESFECSELSKKELVEIAGGDLFLHDLGYLVGRIVNSFVNQKPDPVAVRVSRILG